MVIQRHKKYSVTLTELWHFRAKFGVGCLWFCLKQQNTTSSRVNQKSDNKIQLELLYLMAPRTEFYLNLKRSYMHEFLKRPVNFGIFKFLWIFEGHYQIITFASWSWRPWKWGLHVGYLGCRLPCFLGNGFRNWKSAGFFQKQLFWARSFKVRGQDGMVISFQSHRLILLLRFDSPLTKSFLYFY